MRSLSVLRNIARLFGLFVRDNQDEAIILNILVKLERKSFDAILDLKRYSEQLFGRRVDRVNNEASKLRNRVSCPSMKGPLLLYWRLCRI